MLLCVGVVVSCDSIGMRRGGLLPLVELEGPLGADFAADAGL